MHLLLNGILKYLRMTYYQPLLHQVLYLFIHTYMYLLLLLFLLLVVPSVVAATSTERVRTELGKAETVYVI